MFTKAVISNKHFYCLFCKEKHRPHASINSIDEILYIGENETLYIEGNE